MHTYTYVYVSCRLKFGGPPMCYLFCIKLAFNIYRKVTKPDFRKKIWFIHKVRNCAFLSTFWTFAGNLSVWPQLFLAENDSTKCVWTPCENRISRKNPVLEIFIHKVQILAENGQSGVQRSLYISRTVIAIENLIRYSESTENFLSRMSHQIFAYLSSSGRKFGPKIGNFPKFSKILHFSKKNFFFKVSKWSNSQS